ncbi:LysR family transcriptional regulator [Roseivivax sp. CAU 1761]
MPSHPTFHQLIAFRTVFEQRNITKSAEVLNSSQPALSRSIKELEDAIGRPLFTRTTRSVSPTAAGEELYIWAVRLLEDRDRSIIATRDVADGRTGKISIGYIDFAIVGRLPEFMRRFSEAHPHVHLDLQGLVTQEQLRLLKIGDIDIGFVSGKPQHPGTVQRELYSEGLVAVLPSHHRLASRPSLVLSELENEAFVTGGHQWRYYTDLVMALCRERGFHPPVSQIAPNRDGILSLILAGVGITVYPECIRNSPRHGLSFVPIEDVGRPVVISVVWTEENKNPAMRRLLSQILSPEQNLGTVVTRSTKKSAS